MLIPASGSLIIFVARPDEIRSDGRHTLKGSVYGATHPGHLILSYPKFTPPCFSAGRIAMTWRGCGLYSLMNIHNIYTSSLYSQRDKEQHSKLLFLSDQLAEVHPFLWVVE